MLRRILLALDDSEESARPLGVACELAQGSGASVLVLHVRDRKVACCGEPWETPMDCTPDQLVARSLDQLRSAGVDAQAQIVPGAGRAAYAILDVAADQGADLVVAGWRPRRTFGGLLEKSTGQKLTDAAKRPVLLVP